MKLSLWVEQTITLVEQTFYASVMLVFASVIKKMLAVFAGPLRSNTLADTPQTLASQWAN